MEAASDGVPAVKPPEAQNARIVPTKFTHGAWVVVCLIPALVIMFLVVHRHDEKVACQLPLEGMTPPAPMTTTVLVLVGDLHRGVVKAIQDAQTLLGPRLEDSDHLQQDENHVVTIVIPEFTSSSRTWLMGASPGRA